eukprot:COSAG04_NODE_959_length_9164_cov_3.981798_6_plen_202_part_00
MWCSQRLKPARNGQNRVIKSAVSPDGSPSGREGREKGGEKFDLQIVTTGMVVASGYWVKKSLRTKESVHYAARCSPRADGLTCAPSVHIGPDVHSTHLQLLPTTSVSRSTDVSLALISCRLSVSCCSWVRSSAIVGPSHGSMSLTVLTDAAEHAFAAWCAALRSNSESPIETRCGRSGAPDTCEAHRLRLRAQNSAGRGDR